MVKTMSVNKWGDSLGIRFPSEFVKIMGLREKSRVEVTSRGDEIVIRRTPELLSLEELVANCSEWDGNPPDRYDWGEPCGRELL
jgi:antitoxin MazE